MYVVIRLTKGENRRFSSYVTPFPSHVFCLLRLSVNISCCSGNVKAALLIILTHFHSNGTLKHEFSELVLVRERKYQLKFCCFLKRNMFHESWIPVAFGLLDRHVNILWWTTFYFVLNSDRGTCYLLICCGSLRRNRGQDTSKLTFRFC
jgi:hypothetical protein